MALLAPNCTSIDQFRSIFIWQAIYAVDAIVSTIQHCLSGELEHVKNLVNLSATAIETYVREVALPYTLTFISPQEAEKFNKWVWNSPLLFKELDAQQAEVKVLVNQSRLTSEFLDEFRKQAKIPGICLLERGIIVKD